MAGGGPTGLARDRGRRGAMAHDLNTAEGRRAEIARLEPDLHGLLERKTVAELTQAKLAQAGVLALSRFGSLADNKAEIRTFCQDAMGLHRVNDAVEIAGVVDAWSAAQTRMEARHKAEAEADLSGMPTTLNKIEVQDLRAKFEALHYTLDEKAVPANSTLEMVCDQVETGEWKVMTLAQIQSREDTETDLIGCVVDKAGVIKIRRGYKEGIKPATPEQLRQRIKLLGHTFIFAKIKYPHKAALRDLEPLHFTKLADYLLGEHIMGLEAKDAKGEVVSKPTFELVLSYEHQIRRNAVKLMNRGKAMDEALGESMTDLIVKERYFLTPNSASALVAREELPRGWSRSPHRPWQPPWERPWDAPKGKGKGKSKKGKAGDKGYQGSLHHRTPDGRQICYAWNSASQRCRFSCGRVHVCQKCLGKHPLHACPEVKKGKGDKGAPRDTAGEGAPQA